MSAAQGSVGIRRDGDAFTIHNEHGEVVGLVQVSRDITAQKQAEDEHAKLLESERHARADAEEVNRIKDEFLATISHELRNPLNVILGYSEVLVRSSEANESEFVQRAAEILRRNAIAQAQLVSDLLDLSRLQLGKFSLNRQVVSLTKPSTMRLRQFGPKPSLRV